MKIMKILILFPIFFFSIKLFANENISKLNSLYLNGVIDQKTYFKSIENLGIDTSNDIFTNLFGLFSDRVLEIESYEKSLTNLISVSKAESKKIANSELGISNKNDDTVKNYIIKNCGGDSELCQILSEVQFSVTREDNEIFILREPIQKLIDSDLSLQKIINGKIFLKDNKFDYLLSIQHTRGFVIGLKIGGFIEGKDFFATNLSFRAEGRELLSSDLEEI